MDFRNFEYFFKCECVPQVLGLRGEVLALVAPVTHGLLGVVGEGEALGVLGEPLLHRNGVELLQLLELGAVGVLRVVDARAERAELDDQVGVQDEEAPVERVGGEVGEQLGLRTDETPGSHWARRRTWKGRWSRSQERERSS